MEVEINSPAWKLAGMEYFSGKSTEHWVNLTGVNPASYPEYFQQRHGFHGYGWSVTDKFRADYKFASETRKSWQKMLVHS